MLDRVRDFVEYRRDEMLIVLVSVIIAVLVGIIVFAIILFVNGNVTPVEASPTDTITILRILRML